MSARDGKTHIVLIGVIMVLASRAGFGAARARGPRPPATCADSVADRKEKLPKIDPLPLKRLDRLFDDPNYQFEMKYDGFRGVGYFEEGRCRFISRNDKILARFQPLCAAIAKELKVQNAIFDGELIAPDASGRPIFKDMLRRGTAFQYVAFDLLWLNGEDLRSLPLKERRRKLLKVLPKSSRYIDASLVQVGSGLQMYDLMVQYDLEGVVVKRLSSPYSRSTKWYKFKNKDYSQAKGRRHFF